ncbi:MAG TPA: glucokinase [Candidatus Binataceae bacterium]|nr:glucokinase [Candidatus Binataceae bacterium]
MAARATATVLAGDVGGTKIHLGLYRVAGGKPEIVRDRIFPTRDFKSLEDTLADFLGGRATIDAACFGVPGPVIGGIARPVNVPWTMEERALARVLGVSGARLINDLEATAYGMLYLKESEIVVLQAGEPAPGRAPIAVIAAGTGLGESALLPIEDGRWRSVATEGGHVDFAPRDRLQTELLEFLAREFDHVSYERVLSGPGLVNIYRFLRARGPEPEPRWLAERMAGGEDAAAAISEAALARRDARCVEALEMFVAIYGAEAANLALKYLALGGVYVGGGIAPRILPMLTAAEGGFVRAFLAKGRLSEMLAKIPVRVALNEAAALCGAAHCAMEML